MTQRDTATDIFSAALAAADPYASVRRQLGDILSAYDKGGYRSLLAVSFGKAAAPMMKAVTDEAGSILTKGIVITKYDHAQAADLPKEIEVYEAGHPLPDDNGVSATRRAVSLLQSADAETLVLCLISGGGSALFVSPCEGITLAEKQGVTRSLLKAGADIVELNTVRKHISMVKGGRLAEIAHPARVISLILSDVIGDPLDVIASGPTAPDEATFDGAAGVLEKYGLMDSVPVSVRKLLTDGKHGIIADTPKRDSEVFSNVENIIVGSNTTAAAAAVAHAQKLGYRTDLITTELQGDASEAARKLARIALDAKQSAQPGSRQCFIAGGETTVIVKGNGLGGRNTELALVFGMDIAGVPGITLLSAGTDGTDGPTDAAGAVADGGTVERAKAFGLDPQEYLKNNDSYRFFEKEGGLYKTGPTGTNVMDIQVILVEG